MNAPLLAIKVTTPTIRPRVVVRSRLTQQLDAVRSRRIAVLSAPAGSGKTTLVSEWVDGLECAVAWFSIDSEDGELSRFLAYLVRALQSTGLAVGESTRLRLLTDATIDPAELLTLLLNDLASIERDLVVVLDDYHNVESTEIDDALSFLVDYLPPRVHFVVTTREDPQLPLSRLRARDQLVEIRAHDLGFSKDELASFLRDTMHLAVDDREIEAIENRTEGWVAGAQLAALSLQATDDPHALIASFAGDNRFVVDYLAEEVFGRQPPDVMTFLDETAILERLEADLCNTVTGTRNAREMLDRLERNNIFLVPLDAQRTWYRYHDIFRDALRARGAISKSRTSELHRRAGAWFESHGMPANAIRHAHAAGDTEQVLRVADSVRPSIEGVVESRQWLEWIKPVVENIADQPASIRLGCATAYLTTGQLEAADHVLTTLEEYSGDLQEPIDMARIYLAAARRDASSTIAQGKALLSRLTEGQHARRGQALTLIGLAHWFSGNVHDARKSFSTFLEGALAADDLSNAVSGAFVLSHLTMQTGDVDGAAEVCQRVLGLIDSSELKSPMGTGDLFRELAVIHCERGKLIEATRYLEEAKRCAGGDTLPDWHRRILLSSARIEEAKGDDGVALDLLDEAERMSIRTPLPIVQAIKALRARIFLRQGEINDALRWARSLDIDADGPSEYVHEFEYAVYARVISEESRRSGKASNPTRSLELLSALAQNAEQAGRTIDLLEVLVATVLVQAGHGHTEDALVVLRRALSLAEPIGLTTVFTIEGEEMARLLNQILKRPPRDSFEDRLAAMIQKDAPDDAPGLTIADPLSDRELDVLRLLDSELSGPEIARNLFISLNTLRTHTKHIYAKLAATNRRAALRRARELRYLR